MRHQQNETTHQNKWCTRTKGDDGSSSTWAMARNNENNNNGWGTKGKWAELRKPRARNIVVGKRVPIHLQKDVLEFE